MSVSEPPSREFYRVSEVAKIFGVARATVYGWIEDEKIKSVKLSERAVRVPTEEVERVKKYGLEQKEMAGAGTPSHA